VRSLVGRSLDRRIIEVVALHDHVAEIDADAELDATDHRVIVARTGEDQLAVGDYRRRLWLCDFRLCQ